MDTTHLQSGEKGPAEDVLPEEAETTTYTGALSRASSARTVWCGTAAAQQDRRNLARVVKTAQRIVGAEDPGLDSACEALYCVDMSTNYICLYPQ